MPLAIIKDAKTYESAKTSLAKQESNVDKFNIYKNLTELFINLQ